MQVLVVDGKNLKVGGFNYPWGEMCEKAPCSHNKNSQDEVSYILCILYFKSHLQDGVGTSPGATLKSPKKAKYWDLLPSRRPTDINLILGHVQRPRRRPTDYHIIFGLVQQPRRRPTDNHLKGQCHENFVLTETVGVKTRSN